MIRDFVQNYCKEGEKERLTEKGDPLNSVIIVKIVTYHFWR